MAQITVDIDGCLYSFVDAIWPYLVDRLGPPSSPESETVRLGEHWGIDVSEWNLLFRGAIRDCQVFNALPPYKGAQEAMQALREDGHTLNIVTARMVDGLEEECRRQTYDLLNDNQIPYDTVTFSEDKTVVYADVAIEDIPANLQNLYDAYGTTGILFTRKHNRSIPWSPRVECWDEVPGLVAELLRAP